MGAIEFARDITTLEKLVNQPLQLYGEPITFDVITAVSPEMKRVVQIAKKAAKDKHNLSENDFYKYYPLEMPLLQHPTQNLFEKLVFLNFLYLSVLKYLLLKNQS